MNNMLKYGALAVLAAASAAAQADTAETKGGIAIKSDDGRFEARVGGRIHFDGYLAVDDDDAAQTSTTNFRRARLSLDGKAYGWKYKFECDFTGTGSGCFREMWLGTTLGPANLRIGQAKPYRGMEELTSSNETLFMERPFATASGLYNGNQFAQGLFLDGGSESWTWGMAAYSLRNEAAAASEGFGAAGRLTFAPIVSETTVLHLGASASTDRPTDTAIATRTAAGRAYGRIGGSTAIASTPEDRTALGFEVAVRLGSFYTQAEYATADYKDEATADETVDTYYIQASWLLTGERKAYDTKKAVFKSPKPAGSNGAWELKARYDVIEGEGTPTVGGITAANDELSYWVAGVNWYVNPNVRFMLEYLSGAVDQGSDVEVDVVQLRSQFNF